ncbi:hypothetical protein FSARC_11347 [Fusarium sarcochroum]|uniref:Uncharacterized protein n=1 Tax=Fusarium sarcochroum TaxID=1208366 RepID=A0A8H4X083_9HYPO|nr:hypothetical protein FSARC_11347 [Fusarium sarcochroum]
MIEILLNGLGPKGLIFKRREETITFGVIVSDEFFVKSIPAVSGSPEDLVQFLGWNGSNTHVNQQHVSKISLPLDADFKPAPPPVDIDLPDLDQAILDGKHE